MAVGRITRPDDFESPKPHEAAKKSVVETVLDKIVAGGTTVMSVVSGLLAAALILYSGYVLYDTYQVQNTDSAWQVIDDEVAPLSDPELAARLASTSKDYRGWITLYNTNIDYPVMQGENDTYYASHDVYGNGCVTGAIYLSAENTADMSDNYNIIFGHHMDNKAMFGGLDNYKDGSYFNDNQYKEGVLTSKSGVYDLEVFAVMETDAYEAQVYTGGNRAAEVKSFIESHLSDQGDNSTTLQYDSSIAAGADRVVALSTCKSVETNVRLVVFAKATKRNLITLTVEGYEGTYDGASHTFNVLTTNVPEDADDDLLIEYSTDGGNTWTTEKPSVKDVKDTVEVMVRATDPVYGTATASATLKVNPKDVTVTVNNSSKVYGNEDPEFTAEVSGLVPGESEDLISYEITRTGSEEDVGSYRETLVATGDEEQGNYKVTYVPGTFTITPADTLVVDGTGYSGVYDGNPHAASANVNVPDGTTIEYSTDNGRTWSTTPPSITNVGSIDVLIRATNPNYDTATTTVTLTVTPAKVIVRAVPASKVFGTDDPTFTATVEGVIDGYTIVYTVSRQNADSDTAVGTYEGVIVPAGALTQGNYEITFIPADFTITAAPVVPVPPVVPGGTIPGPGGTPAGPGGVPAAPEAASVVPAAVPAEGIVPIPEEEPAAEITEIEEEETPLAQFVGLFTPRGMEGGVWALINLICIFVTAYILLPILHIKAKFSRGKMMKNLNEIKEELRVAKDLNAEEILERDKINLFAIKERDGSQLTEAAMLDTVTEEEFDNAVEKLYYQVKKFVRHFRIGVVLEIVCVILSIVAFILTENMKLPMVLIDKWTPLMLLILAACWALDVWLVRYRKKVEADEEEFAEQQLPETN